MADWYVSTTGASGNPGTLASPWDLASAATGHSGSIQPGDTVWVRGGTYTQVDATRSFTVSGNVGTGVDNEDGKVIFRAYNPTVNPTATTPRSNWFFGAKGTTAGTGDPTQQERVKFKMQNTSAAPTAGATTVNGVNGNGSTTLSVAKGAGVNQPVVIGQQLTIASGPAAGVYVIQANTTIVQGGNSNVTITPGLRGATAGGEVVTLTLTPSGVDGYQINASFIWFWGIELEGLFSLRSMNTGGALFTTFNLTTDGIKLIYPVMHDSIGPGIFAEKTSGRMELFGGLIYNMGGALGDGGGHGYYLHHTDASKELLAEANCFFNDHGIAMQMFDSTGSVVDHIRFKRNISFNSGQLNNDSALGTLNAVSFVFGGTQSGGINNIIVEENHVFQTDGNGDVAYNFSTAALKIGANVQCINNFARVSGTGFGALRVGTLVASTGEFVHTGNKYRVWRSDATHNGRVYNLAERGNVSKVDQYTWSSNTIYRNLGAGGQSCGDETGGGAPFLANVTGAGACRTITQFLSDCGFTAGTDVRSADPSVTETYVIPADKFEIGRGWALYYNYGGLNPIPINLSSILNPGETFVVHDMRDVYGAAVIGPTTYNGGTVNFPNTQVADPTVIGGQPGIGKEINPPATAPTANAFLVRRTAAAVQGGGGGSSNRKNTNVNASSSSSSI